MVLPDNFSPIEHLQDTIRTWYNREVLQHFSDLDTDEDDLSIPRNSLRIACRHNDDDPVNVTLLRVMLFEMTAKHAASMQPDIYGIPISSYDAEVTYKPQIKLYFSEDSNDVEPGYQACKGEITIRVKNESSQTMTTAKATQLATRIKSVFATPPFVWRKGYDKLVYQDLEKGYDFRVLCRSEQDGRNLINALLDIQQDTPDWSNLNIVTPENPTERFPVNPGSQTIMGRTVRRARKRPIVNVKFRYATLSVYGLPTPINLVDLTGRRRNVLVP